MDLTTISNPDTGFYPYSYLPFLRPTTFSDEDYVSPFPHPEILPRVHCHHLRHDTIRWDLVLDMGILTCSFPPSEGGVSETEHANRGSSVRSHRWCNFADGFVPVRDRAATDASRRPHTTRPMVGLVGNGSGCLARERVERILCWVGYRVSKGDTDDRRQLCGLASREASPRGLKLLLNPFWFAGC